MLNRLRQANEDLMEAIDTNMLDRLVAANLVLTENNLWLLQEMNKMKNVLEGKIVRRKYHAPYSNFIVYRLRFSSVSVILRYTKRVRACFVHQVVQSTLTSFITGPEATPWNRPNNPVAWDARPLCVDTFGIVTFS